MVIAGVFLLLAVLKAPLSANNAAFLTRIEKAVSRMSDKRTAFVRFEKSVTKADAIRCNQLLPNLKPNSNYYADCAFAQAWYGLDYDVNIQRLQRPYRVWRTQTNQWAKEYPTDTDGQKLNDMDGVYTSLNWLYLKHHDVKSLGAWEDLRLDGAWAEGSRGDLAELWQHHAPDMLRAAYHHPSRIAHLAGILASSEEAANDKDSTAKALADARQYTRSKDKRVSSAAQALVKTLRSGKY